MELVKLFFVFMKIGFTSFGGMSMVPIINEEMAGHGWMSTEDVANILAIAEMTPGPLGINCATFAGMQVAGVIGGLVAVLGVLMPAFTITMLVAVFYQKFKETRFMGNVLYVIRPICIGLIIAVMCSMGHTTYWYDAGGVSLLTGNSGIQLPGWLLCLDWRNIIVGCISFYLLLYRKKGVISVIMAAAVGGLLLHMLF